MNWRLAFAVVTAYSAVTLSGCTNARHDNAASNVEDIVQADTAAVDGESAAPEQPAVAEAAPAAEAAPVAETMPQDATPPAAEQPVAQAEPGPSATGTGTEADYTVMSGDTLMKIAFTVYGDIMQWKTIYEKNKNTLANANFIRPGTTLKYDKPAVEPTIEKNGDPYLIKRGDTLGTIADDIYARTDKWRKIWENNKTLIKDPNKIYAGFYLYYQITEEEKREADTIRAKRKGDVPPQQKLGGGETEKLPDSAMNTDKKEPQPAKGGLNSLLESTGTRVPATSGK